MCNFVNFSYRSPFENSHKVANKAHDHAGNKARMALVLAIGFFRVIVILYCLNKLNTWGFCVLVTDSKFFLVIYFVQFFYNSVISRYGPYYPH